MKKWFLILIIALVWSASFSQDIVQTDNEVSSPENITDAALESISGEKGKKRDWRRFRNLFWPTAQLNAVFHKGDSAWLKIHTLDEFIERAGTWYEDNGFREIRLKNEVDQFGNIAHVFQSYSASVYDGKEVQRGINSYQLTFVNDRWWIINLIWDSETNKSKIPEKYLK